jgi:formamidase
MKSITIDRSKHLCDEPDKGHNRWHPDIKPILEVEEGEDVTFETRDACDGYITAGDTIDVLANARPGVTHPLTGPVYVKGARTGDLLEIEFIDIVPERWGFTIIVPGMGFLRDVISTPFLVHWSIADGWATSPQIPGVRIPAAPFMGVSGVAPSPQQLEGWSRREADLLARGDSILPPDPTDAVPSEGPVAAHGLRTLAPRQNGGNMDIRQLTKGARLFLPVGVEGALFSTADAHFAQGDGEVCVAAVEMGATCVVRFRVHPGEATRREIRWPRFQRSDYFAEPTYAMPRKFIATVGMSVDDDGTNGENVNLACRNALLEMINVLKERGFSSEQAYVICSVAMDLRIGQVAAANYSASAFLSEDIFVA